MIKHIYNKLTDDFHDLTKPGTITTYLNPYQYLMLRNDKKILVIFDNVIFDGFLLPMLFSCFGLKKYKPLQPDLSGFFRNIFMDCSNNFKRVILLGGKPGEIELAVAAIRAEFPKIQIVSHRDGYFDNEEEKEVFASMIIRQNPDYVFVGMGVPNQEKFSVILKKKGFKGSVITCGGFFHQTARRLNYYPKFFSSLNIRWIYRIIDEPKLFYRYFVIYPISLSYFIYDVLRYKFSIADPGNKMTLM